MLLINKDANVFVQLFGKRNSTGKIILTKSKNHSNKFEKGNTDLFEINAQNVGDIKLLKIGHDNKGIGPGWHLKEVSVISNGKKFLFPCGRWLDRKEDDGKIERDLLCTDVLVESPKRGDSYREMRAIGNDEIDYIIDVTTSEIPSAGTGKN